MGIYEKVDSSKNHKPFKREMAVGRLLFEGYTPTSRFDLRPANTFYSFNPIDGFGLRLGGLINLKLVNG